MIGGKWVSVLSGAWTIFVRELTYSKIRNLDRLFSIRFVVLIPERPFGYESVDNSGVNVILNSYDVSEYLKISPDGLEVNKFNALMRAEVL